MLVPIHVVGNPNGEIDNGHDEEAHDLDSDSSNPVDEIDSEPITGNGGTDGNDSLEPCNIKNVFEGVDIVFVFEIALVDLRLEEVAAVENDVHQQPGGATGEEVAAMAAEEFLGEKGIGGWIKKRLGFILCNLHYRNVKDFLHVLGGLEDILLNKSCVPA